tara:strand:- start:12 stop:548 length:537 start_codon:yes stop_codon:yes gene_type:complete
LFLERRRTLLWVKVGHEDLVFEVRAISERVAGSFGLQIFDVILRRESTGWVLRVFLDRPGTDSDSSNNPTQESITLGDCQRVSRDLSAVLDTDFTFDYAYTLEVSSPGLDRPLRHLDDCRRFKGRLAKIVVDEAVDGLNHIAGRIDSVEEEDVLIDTGRNVHRIPWTAITRARLEVEF